MRTEHESSPLQRIPEETMWEMARRHTSVQERWEAVWERSRAGRHTMIVGPHTLPPAPPDLQVLCVQCDACGPSGGALEAARRAVLAFEAIDAADAGTVDTIAHMLQHPGWL